MANIKPYAVWNRKWEGGYVNDPDDAGGETNKGITIATWKKAGNDIGEKLKNVIHKGKHYNLVTKSLYEMTDQQHEDVLKRLFWDVWKGDEIKSQSVAEMVVQWFWGSGYEGIKRTQKVLGVVADGIVGNKTLATLNSADPKELFYKLKQARIDHFNEIVQKRPSNAKFLKGWLNRLNDLKFVS